MYDSFGDKRTLFLKALEMYVTESVQSINAELEKPGSALGAVQNALVAFAERRDLSSAEGCIGLKAISEFGQRDAAVTRIIRKAARTQRQTLMGVLARAKKQGELSSDVNLDVMAGFFDRRNQDGSQSGQEPSCTAEDRSLCGKSSRWLDIAPE